MADIDLSDKRITNNEFDKMVSPFELDLIALYSVIEERIQKEIDNANGKEINTDELIKNILDIII